MEFTPELLNRAAVGDQNAITALYEMTYNSVYKSVRALIADEDAVLDILQDSYIKGFQSLAMLDRPENFRAWMKRIAVNKAKDYLKRKKPLLFTDLETDDGQAVDFRDECAQRDPEQVLDRQETTRLINEILGTLSEDQRLVIGLFYYEQLPVRQIAQMLDCSENTVKSRLNYGRKKIEAKVRELEKQGTKLYSLSPLPFLLWLLRNDLRFAESPAPNVLPGVLAKCGAPAAATAGAVPAAAVKAAAAGSKALAVKITAGIVAAAVVVSGAALAVSALRRDKTPDAPESVVAEDHDPAQTLPHESEPPAQMNADPTEAYQQILEACLQTLEADSEAFLNNPDAYYNGDHAAFDYHHRFGAADFYYAYCDIDGNGTEELVIGTGPWESIDVVDLYGFDGTDAVHMIDEPTLGDRSSLTVLEDGSLYLLGGSGAANTTEAYYTVDGTTLQPAPDSPAGPMPINWMKLEADNLPIPSAALIEPENSYVPGLYASIADGSGLMVRIEPIDQTSFTVFFSSPVSNDEPSYTVTLDDGFWELWIGEELMFFDFTQADGMLFVEGSAPADLGHFLGVYEII